MRKCIIGLVAVAEFCAGASTLYTIGNVPPLQVAQSSTLQFTLTSPKSGLATFSYTVDPGYPTPQGAITLNSSTGLFTYSPVPADKFQFSLRFTAAMPGQAPDSQSVVITPVTSLIPESDVITHTGLPDGASTDYLVVTQSQNPTPELFNSQDGNTQTTYNVEITGKTVVFDSSSTLYGQLYARFHNRANLKNVTIYAEALIIRSPLKLPGTNVTVYAQQLRFEDTAGQASLDTTPIGYSRAAAQFQNGLPGQKGGDITLRIQNFYSQPGPSVRLISGGGIGQDAGQGRAGNSQAPLQADGGWTGANQLYSGLNLKYWPGTGQAVSGEVIASPPPPVPYQVANCGRNGCSLATTKSGAIIRFPTQPAQPAPIPQTVVYEEYRQCALEASLGAGYPATGAVPGPCVTTTQTWGSKIWPADGQDAVSPGKPGNGGAGGSLSGSLANLSSFWMSKGANAGRPADPQAGGPAQQPANAVWVQFLSVYQPCSNHCSGYMQLDGYWSVLAQHTAIKGKDAPSRPADIPVGAAGTFTTFAGQAAQWLHPYFLRQVIAYAKDAYRAGNLQFAQDTFTAYLAALKDYGTPPPEFALALEQAQQEMEGLLFQITNNIDYFGNGAGWVPLLSLEANMSAFNSEVDAAVPLIYLSLYLQTKSDQNQKDVTAINDSISNLNTDVAQTGIEVNNALQAVPALQLQASQLATQLGLEQTALQNRENYLIQKAKDNVEEQNNVPAWQTGLRVLGTVVQVASVAVPALRPVAIGLTVLNSIDNSTPWTQIQGYSSAAGDFLDFKYQDAATQLQNAVKNITFTPATAKDAAKSIADAANTFAGFVEARIKSNEQQQIPDSAVNDEYAKLRAQDGELNDLIQQVANLQAQKAAFDQAVAQTNQTISTDTAKITQDLVTITSLYQNLDAKVTQADHATMLSVRDMDRRARERLVRYQYYLTKSYEYRMLQPYPYDLNLQCGDPNKCVIDKILSVMATDGYPANPVNLTAIKEVYKESVRQIVYSSLSQYQIQPHDISLPFLLELTTPELQQLNQTGQVTIDISSRIAGQPNEQNRHIVNVAVDFMGVQPTGAIPAGAARVRTIIAHQGRSTETLNGHTFQFYFGTSSKDTPFTWGASYDLLSNQLAQEVPGPDVVSFMKTVLNLPATTGDVSVLFARPGADAMLTITKAPTPANLSALITKLRLAVTVDFFRINSNQVTLLVQTDNGNLPYVVVSQTDTTGRNDGLGTFRRTYNIGQPITLTAEPIYQGLKFAYWADDQGNNLGTSPKLTLTLASSMSVHPVYEPITLTPTVGPPSPTAGSGFGQTFTFTFSDSAGYQNLGVMDILMNNSLDGRHACYIAFVASGPTSGTVYVVDDTGDAGGPFSVLTLPGSGSASNGQCTISGTGSSVNASGNNLTLTLAFAFNQAFAGNKIFYLAAGDTASHNSGWQALGTWRVPGPATSGPQVSGVNPARSNTLSQNYTFSLTDTNGWQDIGIVDILINDGIDGRRACYVAFVPSSSSGGSVFVVDDVGDAGGPFSSIVLPGSATASNDQCAVAGTGSTVNGSGNTLMLTLAMAFNPSFAGNHIIFLAARSNTGNSNWQAVGSVTVP